MRKDGASTTDTLTGDNLAKRTSASSVTNQTNDNFNIKADQHLRRREDSGGVMVEVSCRGGMPQLTVPLPSRRERCRFTLRPVSHTVGDLLAMLKHEDRGIDRVTVTTNDGVRIASSSSIESLLMDDFKLTINDVEYNVDVPDRDMLNITKDDLNRLSDVRTLVHQLYEALNVEEHQIKKEHELVTKLESLKVSLEPLEKKRQSLEAVAVRRTTALTWFGLSLMSVQFGILARLTWWEYSWDIMEPVTYFVTYGTAMAAYAYFVLTKQEYLLPDVRDRQHLITLHKRANKIGLDVVRYNSLKDEIARIEQDLARLRDPLHLHVPPTPTYSFPTPSARRICAVFSRPPALH